jgi:hypothetical protein
MVVLRKHVGPVFGCPSNRACDKELLEPLQHLQFHSPQKEGFNETANMEDLKALFAAVNVVLVLVMIAGGHNIMRVKPLSQDFLLGLRMGSHGLVSGQVKARAIDFTSSGEGNNIVS